MNAIRIVAVLLSVVFASGACVLFWQSGETKADHNPEAIKEAESAQDSPDLGDNEPFLVREAQTVPVQSVEERGDAMLFEIDALQNIPFDRSITMPFEQSAR